MSTLGEGSFELSVWLAASTDFGGAARAFGAAGGAEIRSTASAPLLRPLSSSAWLSAGAATAARASARTMRVGFIGDLLWGC